MRSESAPCDSPSPAERRSLKPPRPSAELRSPGRLHGSRAKAATALFLAWNALSGVTQSTRDEEREAATAFQASPESLSRQRRARFEETLGPDFIRRLDWHASHEAWSAKTRRYIEAAPERRGFVSGFEALGYDNAAIEAALRQVLPKEWLSRANLTEIRLGRAIDDLPQGYDQTRATEGECRYNQGPGYSSPIQLFADAFRGMPEPVRSQRVLLALLHEVAHANAPGVSMTAPAAQREAQADWLVARVRSMQRAPYEIGIRRVSHWGHQVRSLSRRWLGDRYAYPEAGEGALPFGYPNTVHGRTSQETARLAFDELFPEVISIALSLELPDEAFVSDAAWEREVAARLAEGQAARVADTSERVGRAFEDALAHARFVRRAIPDVRERSWNLQRLLRRGHLFRPDQNPLPSWPENRPLASAPAKG